jgi:hypothetical protein
MKIKRSTRGKAEIEPKDDVDVRGNPHTAAALKLRNYSAYREQHSYFAEVITLLFPSLTVMFVAIASGRIVSLVLSTLPQIPLAYDSLVGMVVSSIVGISVSFLFARFINKRRNAEREIVIERVRFKEKELFKMFDLDFDSITKRRELDAGQTV